MAEPLTPYEVKVLRLCAGHYVPDVQPGAALNQAIDVLKARSLIMPGIMAGTFDATPAGAAYLQQLETP